MAEVKPTFLIVGAAKCGTTSLHWMLSQHPDVFMSPIKETNYFAYDESRGDHKRFRVRSREAYLDLFQEGAGHLARGEASPIYMVDPKAAERIHSELPEARLIAILRDPADRAYSAYRMNLRLKKRPFDAKAAFAPDAKWLQPASHVASAGRYAERLRPFLERFPRERIKLLLFEDLKNDPQRLLNEVFGFLGLETARIPWSGTRHNYGGTPRSSLLERAIRATRIGPLLRRRPGLEGMVRRLRNAALADPPPLPREVRRLLIGAYLEDVRELEELLGRDLSAWRSDGLQESRQP